MNNLQEFTNGDIKLPVRLKENGDIEFNVEKAAIGLGISTVAKSGNVVVRWQRVRNYLNSPQLEKGDFITEPQFYKLAIKANNAIAEKFQDWVTTEVLPSIRKHGAYLTDSAIEQTLTDPDYLIRLATQLKTEREGRLIAEKTVKDLKPKASYYDKVLSNPSLMNITSIAKDYGYSAISFNKLLHELKIKYSQSGTWYFYSKYQDRGWTQSKTFPYKGASGNGSNIQTKWTQKGRLGLYKELKKHGIVPKIEQLFMEV
ncbi:MAG TPA: phage antirepressor KilAC domain-containing protein [Candidatus Companilactobacillus pullicola]|uniref:Phage antirepressor KilAC domain-containing protein n=1 Tax=Candidatus Companilactobacillus pullicola TaxID=2838523 RepID=A0A9D2CMN2_9LACO|nr:phage antirepressor KilAC domain-containing protein [Candidatus Companilactobacillus pullicola]